MVLKYTSGQNSHSFWQNEFTTAVELYLEGKSSIEMKKLSIEENIYAQVTPNRRNLVAQVMNNRIKVSDERLLNIYQELQKQDQRFVNLVAIMATNRLLQEFILEDFRNEILLGDSVIEEHEWTRFLRRKESESSVVNNWTEENKGRVFRMIKTCIREAGLTKFENGIDTIQMHVLDFRLIDALNQMGHSDYVAAFSGV